MKRTATLLVACVLLVCAILCSGCLSGTTAPGPVTAVVPAYGGVGWLQEQDVQGTDGHPDSPAQALGHIASAFG
jgi:hypothetical protein